MSIYLDSSAIVKLVRAEPESEALRDLLRSTQHRQLTSVLSLVEVTRAVTSGGAAMVDTAREAMEQLGILPLSEAVLEEAASLLPGSKVRTLDAIHLASARAVSDLQALVTYDRRLADAARSVGLAVEAPA